MVLRGLNPQTRRRVIMGVIGVDLLALAAFAVHVDEQTVTTSQAASASQELPATPEPKAPAAKPAWHQTDTKPQAARHIAGTKPHTVTHHVPETYTPGQSGSTGTESTGSASTPSTSTSSSQTPSTPPKTSAPKKKTPPKSTPTDPGKTDDSKAIPPCPVKVAKHDASGGLQSLIPFAGAFGPFKPEAFQAAAAYQPMLQLIGPILAQYPTIEPTVGPAISPFLDAFGGLLGKGFDFSQPLYGPQRTQVLQQESKLAAALAPYSQKFAYSKYGGCIVELENALITDTIDSAKSGKAPSKSAVAARLDELVAQAKKSK